MFYEVYISILSNLVNMFSAIAFQHLFINETNEYSNSTENILRCEIKLLVKAFHLLWLCKGGNIQMSQVVNWDRGYFPWTPGNLPESNHT